ncbi:hypothetical protein AGMMS50212_17220 [Spirochaetia bacterium]|nr:hypothetical protein AGMMS50212_17220 [Spirochaetia bacterium]
MIDMEMLKLIAVVAFETVGLIELLKVWISPPAKLWAIIMIPVALGFSFVYLKLPEWVTVGVLSVTACQLGYDVLLQGFKKIIKKTAGD